MRMVVYPTLALTAILRIALPGGVGRVGSATSGQLADYIAGGVGTQ